MKTKPVVKSDVGRFVRVVFEDVGALDGVIVEVEEKNNFHFLCLETRERTHNNGAPAIVLGKHVTSVGSGLDA